MQLGRAQPLETLLGLCLLLARLAAAPGYVALSAALLEPLGPALEALWCAFERLEAAARPGGNAASAAQAAQAAATAAAAATTTAAEGGGAAAAEGGSGGGGGGERTSAPGLCLASSLQLLLCGFVRALRATLCGHAAGAQP